MEDEGGGWTEEGLVPDMGSNLRPRGPGREPIIAGWAVNLSHSRNTETSNVLSSSQPASKRRTRVRVRLAIAGAVGVVALSAFRATTSAPRGAMSTACPTAQSFRWLPAQPRSGSLFRVQLVSEGSAAESAGADAARPLHEQLSAVTISGEPLHFHRVDGQTTALAAVPVDSANGVNITWRCVTGDTGSTRIGTASGDYPLERLRVAPKFSAPASPALTRRMQREAAQAADVSRNSHGTPKLWATAFITPRTSRITSPFGGGRTFNGTVTSRHMGTDFAGAVGAPVRAANRGIVRLIGSFYLGGNVIYLDHGEGLVTAYLHLSKHLVAVGDTVAQGAVIGQVGATGRVTGPHLHVIARYGAITIDPASLFNSPGP